MIDVRDVAEVAMKALLETDHANKIYVLTGPEVVTYFDVARLLSEATGKPIVYETLSEDDAVKELIESGVSEPVARSRVEIHRSFSTGACAEVTGDAYKLLQRTPRSFAEFARDNAFLFR
jgi:uncharacterized protein YbjT (DUF2867 family)